MRNTFIGLAAAAAIVVVLFAISRLIPPSATTPAAVRPPTANPQQIAQSASVVKPGYIGTVDIGAWKLECGAAPKETPAPSSINAQGTAAPAPKGEVKFGRCRTALLVHDKAHPKGVVLIAVLRPVQKTDELALILHVPPVTKPGAKVIVALAEKQIIGLPVANCEKTQCIAFGVLKSNVAAQLLARPRLAVVVTIQATGQRMVIPMSTQGLPQSVAALRRAG